MRSNVPTLQKFKDEIDRRENAKQDFVVGANSLSMEGDAALAFGGTSYPLTDYAHGQVATYTGIPKRYYDRMTEIDGLRTHNVNAWFGNAGPETRRMVRTLDGRARALVSDRYRPIDNYLIFRAFLPVLEQYPEAQFKAHTLSDTRMYMQVVFPRLEARVKRGDVVRYGLTLTNSEVGAGSVDVATMVWRLVCENGMVGESLINKRHVGRRVGDADEDYQMFRDDTIMAELKSFQLRLRDTLENAMTEKAFQEYVDKMRVAAREEIARPEATIENVTKRYQWLTDDDSEAMLRNIINEKDFSRWGLVNSVTALAHNTDDGDRQFEYEKLGNQLLQLPSPEWKKLAA